MRVHASLNREARLAGAAARPFREPGVDDNFAPDRRFGIEHVALDLRIDPVAGQLVAVARLSLTPTPTGMGPVLLHLDEVTVDAVEWDGPAEPGVRWTHDDGELRVRGPSGAGTLTVRYGGAPRRGLYFIAPDAARPDRGHQVWSQCQDEDGHFFFPCFDHPSARQRFTITVDAPADYTVLSNGRLDGQEDLDEGWRRWRWRQDEPIAAYLVTVVVAQLKAVEDHHGELSVRYLVPPHFSDADTRRVFGRTPEMIAVYEETFGVPFPWDRYDQVTVEDFIFGGMENVAATTMTDLLLIDERAWGDYDGQSLIAHELGHQWFGDLVTCQDWSQAWLNEGWATFSECVWARHAHGRGYAAWYTWSKAQAYFEESDGRYARPVVSYAFREPIDVFDRHLYEKGACVLNTLRYQLGDKLFWPGVRGYLERHRMSTVHTRHFQRALEDATGYNLDRFFRQWVHAPGYPSLEVKLSHDEDRRLLNVQVKQTQTGEGVPERFHLNLRLEMVCEEEIQIVDLWVRERERSWAVPCVYPPLRVRVDADFRVLSRIKLDAPRRWLINALAHDDCPVMRIRSARALAREVHPEAAGALRDALTRDPDWYVRAELAGVLGKLGGEAARDALLSALDTEPNPRVRRDVVTALGSFRDDVVGDRLLKVVEDGDPGLLAEGEAGFALGRMRSPHARRACALLLERDAWGDALRTRGLRGLGASRDPEVLDTLLFWTGADRAPRVQAAAVTALGQLIDEVPDLSPAAFDRLIELIRESPFRVQLAAIGAAGKLRDPRAAPALRQVHESAPDGRTRRMAFEALASVRDGRTGEHALASLRATVEALERKHNDLRDRLDRLSKD
ncbi:MAG: M1 family metallopeptidase [Alphaproteobacteria bacterium]|nr:M1 family metallopeptidase [Alphaproteobacteria bacterium]